MRTTPTNVLLDINGEQSIITRWQFLLNKFLFRVTARKSHPLYYILDPLIQLPEEVRSPLRNLVNSYIDNLHIFKQVEQVHLPSFFRYPYLIRHFTPAIDVSSGFAFSDRNNNDIVASFNDFLLKQSADLVIYTDGSLLVWKIRIGLVTQLYSLTSIFQVKKFSSSLALTTIPRCLMLRPRPSRKQ